MPRGVSAALLNVALATLYALFLIRHADAFLATHELPLLAVVALETMVVVMFVARREASVTNLSPLALAATALGTFSTLFVAPIQSSNVPSAITVAIQLVGLTMATIAMGSLRRSSGSRLPTEESRRPACTGMSVIRYAAYLVTFGGYVLAYPAPRNLVVLACAIAGQVLRMQLEERLLLRDPQYVDYAARTRFRIVPGLY